MPEVKDEGLEDVLRKLAHEVPEALRPCFEAELKELIASFREQIRLKSALPPSKRNRLPVKLDDLNGQAALVLENWKKRKAIEVVYDRYCELMKSQSFTPDSLHFFAGVAVDKKFALRVRYRQYTRMVFFEEIEKRGIKIGSKVRLPKKSEVLTVKVITSECVIFLSGSRGCRRVPESPFNLIMVDEEDVK